MTLPRLPRLSANDLWRDPVYLRLWSSILTSSFGNQVMMLALPLTAAVLLQATPTQMGLLTAIELVPFLLLSLPSGYQRDLQLLKFPLFRGIDLAQQTFDILAAALGAVQFRAAAIHIDPAVHAAGEAYELVVREGIPFREAYRRVAARFRTADKP